MHSIPLFRTLATAVLATAFLDSAAGQTCDVADQYEPNDSCFMATPPLPVGVHTGFTMNASTYIDWYRFDVRPGEWVMVDCTYVQADGNIDLSLELNANLCQGFFDISDGFTGHESIGYGNASFPTPLPAYIAVRSAPSETGDPFQCNHYDLTISRGPILDLCPDDDANWNCSDVTNTELTEGVWPGLVLKHEYPYDQSQVDYFHITVGANQRVLVDLDFQHAAGDIDALLREDGCLGWQVVDESMSSTDSEFLVYENPTLAPVDVVLEARLPFPFSCNTYDVEVLLEDLPQCYLEFDDAFAPNADCSEAAQISAGSFGPLYTNGTKVDHFRLEVPAGQALNVQADFLHDPQLGGVDLHLYDASSFLLGHCGAGGLPIASSSTTSDTELLTVTNFASLSQVYFVAVQQDSPANPEHCVEYSLDVQLVDAGTAIPMCLAEDPYGECPCGNVPPAGSAVGCTHSGGIGARLVANGSASASADDLVLTVEDAIPGAPSVLVQGAALVQLPFRDGMLCAGNPTERIQVVLLDANGSGSTSASIVTAGNVVAGDLRYYQQWYRDAGGVSPCGSGSNLTQGLRVQWLP